MVTISIVRLEDLSSRFHDNSLQTFWDGSDQEAAMILVTINLSPAFHNFFPEVIFIFTFFLRYFTLDHSQNIFCRPDIRGFRGLGAVFKPETKGVCLQSGFISVDGGCIILKNRISLCIYFKDSLHTPNTGQKATSSRLSGSDRRIW